MDKKMFLLIKIMEYRIRKIVMLFEVSPADFVILLASFLENCFPCIKTANICTNFYKDCKVTLFSMSLFGT